ncbi:4a-hydroxytetrahydrobiopterin dehydratase [soil metagenome]
MAELLSDDDVRARLGDLGAWELADGKLHRRVELADFAEAFGFMTRVALLAEKADHHPDWSNSWNVVDIELVSHSAGGVTTADLEMAARISALLDPSP